MDSLLSQQPVPFGQIVRDAETIFKMSRRSTAVYLNRLTESNLVCTSGGVYWLPTPADSASAASFSDR